MEGKMALRDDLIDHVLGEDDVPRTALAAALEHLLAHWRGCKLHGGYSVAEVRECVEDDLAALAAALDRLLDSPVALRRLKRLAVRMPCPHCGETVVVAPDGVCEACGRRLAAKEA
jgi:rRNA maturation endonuclease Nob1